MSDLRRLALERAVHDPCEECKVEDHDCITSTMYRLCECSGEAKIGESGNALKPRQSVSHSRLYPTASTVPQRLPFLLSRS